MNAITEFDLYILHLTEDHLQNPLLTFFFKIFTYASEMGAIWVTAAIIILITKKYRKNGFITIVSLLLCFVFTNLILKNTIARPRPFSIDDFSLLIPKPSEFSFPSGHSAISFCGAYSLSYTNRKWTPFVYIIAVLTAFSRIYFTVHYPTDVIGGIIIGTLCSVFTIFVFKKIEKKTNFFNNKFFLKGNKNQ